MIKNRENLIWSLLKTDTFKKKIIKKVSSLSRLSTGHMAKRWLVREMFDKHRRDFDLNTDLELYVQCSHHCPLINLQSHLYKCHHKQLTYEGRWWNIADHTMDSVSNKGCSWVFWQTYKLYQHNLCRRLKRKTVINKHSFSWQ